ncbi:MAG TPA: condensation domain-containing protein, partial [Thermoanaerobaculia bacterium]|nr:condensation domain-containing protein [Thermoanaerobaculia bacterium]
MSDLSKSIAGLTPEKRRLLERLLRQQGVDLSRSVILPQPRDPAGSPLSFAQQRLWFLDQLAPGGVSYNVPGLFLLRGDLDVAALAAGIAAIVERHEILRTTFGLAGGGGEPVQLVNPPEPFPLPVVDLGGLPEPARLPEVRRLAFEQVRRPFDLARGPLLRGILAALDGRERAILLTTHHIVTDGWSMVLLMKELGALYEAFAQGRPSPLPPLPLQYADFAVWQRRWLTGEVLESELAYWRSRLGDLPSALELPVDHPRPAVQTFDGAIRSLPLPADLLDRLQELSQRRGTTLFMTLLAAFKTLLWRYTGQADFAVGTPTAGRNRKEVEGLIGFFVNTLVLRTDLAGDPPFLELLDRVREVTLSAYSHQDLPLEKLVQELQPERDLSRTPLFQVVFALQNTPPGAAETPGFELVPLMTDSGVANYDLTLTVLAAEVQVQYNRDLFNATTVQRLAGHFAVLLRAAADGTERRLSDLPLLTEAERTQALVQWNDTDRPCPQVPLVHELFAAQARRRPDAPAVVTPEACLTYGELAARADRLARHLRSL